MSQKENNGKKFSLRDAFRSPNTLRVLICVLGTALIIGLFEVAIVPMRYNLQVGMVPTTTISATKDVVDELSTEQRRKEAAAQVTPTYRYQEGITEQDEKIAGIAHEAGKASIICLNKWDAVDKDNSTVNEMTKKIYDSLSFMTYAPIMFISAKTGQRVDKLFEQINYVNGQSKMRASTGMINDVLSEAVTRVQPPSDKGRRLKIYYMTEISVAPPTFVIFCNNADLFHFSYQRYIENQLRQVFGFKGTPIRLIIRQKDEEENT